jgi:hypothetical protein
MPPASAFDWGIRILPGARDKIRSREPRRTTTVIENVTRYTGIGVSIFVVGSGICEKDDAYRSGGDPYFVCGGKGVRLSEAMMAARVGPETEFPAAVET